MNTNIAATIQIVERKRDELQRLIDELRRLGALDENGSAPAPAQGETRLRRVGALARVPRKGARRKRSEGVSRVTNEGRSSDVSSPAAAPIPAGSGGNDDDNSAVSERAIKIGRSLNDPFTPTDVRARFEDQHPRRPFWWINTWLKRGWIENSGYGQYRKTAGFGT